MVLGIIMEVRLDMKEVVEVEKEVVLRLVLETVVVFCLRL